MTGGRMLLAKYSVRSWWKVMLLLSVPPMPRSHGLVFFPCCLYPLASIPLACFFIPSFSHTELETIVRSTRITARDATLSASRIVALTTATSSSSSTAAASTQVVLVGYNSHEFHPNNLTAKAGDLIVFQFVAQGHTVVQANFEQPCIPRDTYHRDRSTFFSGWYNGSDVLSDNPPTWNLTVNDTKPIFFYCSRLDSCLKNNMIGSINQNGTQSLQDQLDSIQKATVMLQPGDPPPEESVSSPTTSSTPSSTSSTVQTSAAAVHHGVTLSGGAIAGIVVAGVVVLALACALFWFVGRHRTLKHSLNSQSSHSQHSGAVESWVNSTQPPSTVGGPSSQRPPSYGGDPGFVPVDQPKHWEYGQQRHSYMPMTPPIQELGASEPVEMEETGRGRTMSRNRESESLIPKW
ncbi:hypothetical protein D6D20_07747 [Aureobasidium pullulans]|uniref:Cupredoxin n=1 Tax=Aureobasidium pullulans TaxID=5580 RepID=A0A4S8Z0K4_AURPU|nr:hypothetical protein D6D20_07747 [Aureobasidium pullulans]